MNAKPIIVLVGPTASGKTLLSIPLAKHYKGEIISGDSRQLYRCLDVGSGKITRVEMSDIRHHLIDCFNPGEQCTLADFKARAEQALYEIQLRGSLPFLVGGSMLYVDALVEGYHLPEVGRDENYRIYLERLDLNERLALLQRVDPVTFGIIDHKNVRRIIRALEVYHLSGIPFSQQTKKNESSSLNVLKLCITLPRMKLYEAIDHRVDVRMDGMIEEVRELLASGIEEQWLINLGLEYRFLTRYLTQTSQKLSDREEMTQKLKYAIHDFARRQLVWYRRDTSLLWIDGYDGACTAIDAFLKK